MGVMFQLQEAYDPDQEMTNDYEASESLNNFYNNLYKGSYKIETRNDANNKTYDDDDYFNYY